jgi:hypothetical protein
MISQRRKPFQFGLLALLVLMAVVAFLLRVYDPWTVAAVDLLLIVALVVVLAEAKWRK